ncbi:DUF4911 domain-containing protein [Oceanidesulfovibrio marinus]|uniref:DUF4911 domain-containing protein n=1 Tax=Oceanidesulfovibrio marinus TaxID=370038 RepID=A0ABX6NJ97_9BACT|nr:DUF4911 domain-containing protein [Oceanidesulfovibrio marinus]QJT10743.1 DUF4911 domain-containing protein [Oceanidesulfovibrio marinus]
MSTADNHEIETGVPDSGAPEKKSPRKRRPRREPPTWSARLYLRIAPANMALARFLLEADDNLGYLSTLDRATGLLVFIHSPDQSREARAFIEDARTLMPIEIVDTGSALNQ